MLRELADKYDLISEPEGNAIRVMEDGKWGLLNVHYGAMTDLEYDYIYKFENGFAQVKLGKKFGIINDLGKFIIDTKYAHIYDFDKDLAIVCNGKHWGAVNKFGRVVIPIIYEREFHFWERDYAIVKYCNKYNIIGRNGKLILAHMAEEITLTGNVFDITVTSNTVSIKI